MSEHTSSGAHITPVRTLVVVWIALLIGTWLTLTATYFDFGGLNLLIGLAIATGKALLVALYFMHMRWDKPFNAFVFMCAFALLGLFIGIALMDSSHYQNVVIQGYAPAVPQ